MKILVTGSKGFIGRNLVSELRNRKIYDIYEFDINSSSEELSHFTSDCEFVFHLAGVNRPEDPSEYMTGNFGLTNLLLENLKKNKNTCPVMISSSIKADDDSLYGRSKKAGEDLVFSYGHQTGSKILVYRFPNVFGKWCKPNYNSAIATFSYNIAHNLPIYVSDPKIILDLVYIDDVVLDLINALTNNDLSADSFCYVKPVYRVSLEEIVRLLYSYKDSLKSLYVPSLSDGFGRKLYANYLSYVPKDQFCSDLLMNFDSRGSFTEFFKSTDRGQTSVNISKPGVIKGNHWHHSKNEKFLVVFGIGIIRLRQIFDSEVIEINVCGEKLQIVNIPPGYTHNIENVGSTDLVTIMWASEVYDSSNPDTYFMEV